jgi:hypothetical protein
LALLAAGCSSTGDDEIRGKSFTKVLTPEIPPFLKGPMGLLLTNASGFSARVTLEIESFDPSEPAPSGQLLCRHSKLLFAPDPTDKAEKRGGFSFIWDVAENRGYVLSEALQGYALVGSNLQATNVVTGAIQATPRKFGGHTCAPGDASIQMSDGSGAIFQLLRANDLNGFPIHISAATNLVPLAITLSRIRLEVPPADLFAPPEGFTKYESPQFMADELALRQHNLKRKTPEELLPPDHTAPEPNRRH